MNCIGYLLLYNKSAHNLVAKKYQTLLSPSFCGLGIQGLAYLGASASKALTRLRCCLESVVSFEASAEGGSGSELTHVLLAEFSSSWAIGLVFQLFTSCWLQVSLSSFPHGPLHKAARFHHKLARENKKEHAEWKP